MDLKLSGNLLVQGVEVRPDSAGAYPAEMRNDCQRTRQAQWISGQRGPFVTQQASSVKETWFLP